MRDEERLVENYIPDNYDSGISLLGFNFKVRFLIEGVILAAVLGLIGYVAMSYMNIEYGNKLGITIVFLLFGLIFGIRGINDETITQYLSCFFNFRKRRRTAYYNPRVKTEAVPFYKQNNKELPIDKILAFYNKYKTIIDKNSQQKSLNAQSQKKFDENLMYFQDDIGVVDKPREYMTDKEYKALLKQEKKERKARAKQAKKEGRRIIQ